MQYYTFEIAYTTDQGLGYVTVTAADPDAAIADIKEAMVNLDIVFVRQL